MGLNENDETYKDGWIRLWIKLNKIYLNIGSKMEISEVKRSNRITTNLVGLLAIAIEGGDRGFVGKRGFE